MDMKWKLNGNGNGMIMEGKWDGMEMDWKWNGLYTANVKIKDCHFVHFFLKDKLPNRGEDVGALMNDV